MGGWNEQKDRLKLKFATLTDGDILFVEGKNDELIERLELKLGKTKEEIKQILASL